MRSLLGLPLARVDTIPIMGDAMRFALLNDISVCDAIYAALARACKVPLLTADERLSRRLSGLDMDVVTLGSL